MEVLLCYDDLDWRPGSKVVTELNNLYFMFYAATGNYVQVDHLTQNWRYACTLAYLATAKDWTKWTLSYKTASDLRLLAPEVFKGFTTVYGCDAVSFQPSKDTRYVVATGSNKPWYDMSLSKEKSEVTRPLTKEEAKLKRQETQAGATLKQVSFVVNRVTEIISQGTSEFGLVEDLLPESVTAVKEVFPFVKLTQVDKSKTYEPGVNRSVIVEFVD